MKPKHILVYCPVFLPQQSGYSHAFVQLIDTLLEQGVQVDVVTPELLEAGREEPFQHPLLRIFRYTPKLSVWLLGLLYSSGKRAGFINKLNDAYSYDMVWVETGDDPLLLASLNRKVLHKTVVRFHATSDTEYLLVSKAKKYRIRKFVWRNLSAYNIRFVSATNAYHLHFAMQYLLKSASIVGAGVCINTVNKAVSNRSAIHAAKQFVMLGRMDREGYKQKGFDLVLEALPLVNETALRLDAKLTIIGSGEYANQFKKEVSQYAWVNHIEELPHEHIASILQKSDVVLMPSRYEGLSIFALEALGAGLGFVMSDVGGLRDLWANNGWLVTPLNGQELAKSMIEAMQDEHLLFKQQQSESLAQQTFTKQVQWQQFLKIWEGVQNG
ncbi:MAG: glycosyltransferase family 4 protein [Bacteroidia bacterium]|jgi:glycosyltransferase involved in cell wall biosynthesis|nr:glycosyltransferase family 4 protein [Bacteroidia bacterium]